MLIGTGFYASAENLAAKRREFSVWVANTIAKCGNIVVVDNSEPPGVLPGGNFRVVRVNQNLGHMSAPARHAYKFTGWSISWIIPALIAYSEGEDFCYKEQDCFAFGDWPEEIQCGDFTVGRNAIMPCEQSLFFIRHHRILNVIESYMDIRRRDTDMSTEEKFMLCGATFHGLACGRDRPLPKGVKTWYAQKLTKDEINEHCNSRLV